MILDISLRSYFYQKQKKPCVVDMVLAISQTFFECKNKSYTISTIVEITEKSALSLIVTVRILN